MKILISAAEASSDTHGAAFLRALRQETSATVDAFGIGGPALQAQGLRAIVDARGLLSMGFLEILTKIPRFLRSLRELEKAARREKPAIAVVIDYPDFHFRLARRLRALGIPVVYFIPPKVWVWRRARVKILRERFARVLSIFPFETDFLKAENVPVVYVGNPLVDELPLTLSQAAARARLAIDENAPVLTLLPGSRPAELKHHLEPLLEATRISVGRLHAAGWAPLGFGKPVRVLIPIAPTTDLRAIEAGVGAWRKKQSPETLARLTIEVRSGEQASALALLAANAGIVKSGTSTLEAGVLLCPHVVVYRPNAFSNWIFHTFIRYPGPVGLVNLVGGYFGKPRRDCPVKELICEEVTPEAIADALVPLLIDAPRRARMLAYLTEVRARLLGTGLANGLANGMSPSLAAAREVLAVLRETGRS